MRHVGSLRFELRSDGDLGGLPVRSAEGVLTDEGAAQGTVSLEEGGALAEFEFVIAGSSYFVKGPTGGWQSLPSAIAANVYDPTRLLDPDRGVSTLLEQAHGGVTRGREDVDDRPSYRIAATLRGEDLASAVPVPPDAEVPAILWVDAGSGYLLQARVRVPAGAGGTTTVALRLSDFGEPTTIVTPT
jgi:lipoprotein LprG